MQVKYLLLFRAVLLETILLNILYTPNATFGGLWWVWIALAAYAFSALTLYWFGSRKKLTDIFLTFSFALDIGITSIILYFTQGFKSDFYVAYFLVILSSCVLEKLSYSFIVASVACLVYGYFAFPGWVNFQPFYLLHLSLLLVTTFFSTYMTYSARRIGYVTADRYEAQLAWMQRLSMVGKTMAGVLHEVKTPLGTIILNTEQIRALLRRGRDIQEPLAAIEQEAERAVSILSDFLDFVRPKELELKSILLRDSLEKALDSLRLHLTERNIQLETNFLDGTYILGSSRHLIQVFTNIILNAIEAMPHGGALRIREIMRNEHVKIEFSDTGVGMSRETLEHLFEPFLTSKPDSGYGLGLTVVRWIIQKHSGKLHIYSDGPNKGTTVVISVPKNLPI